LPQIFSGEVAVVIDGDTIEVLHNTSPERIRLSGIDCPEKGQAFGKKARQDFLTAYRNPVLRSGVFGSEF
jgi:endonuclease YncB( thermonuclease family)